MQWYCINVLIAKRTTYTLAKIPLVRPNIPLTPLEHLSIVAMLDFVISINCAYVLPIYT